MQSGGLHEAIGGDPTRLILAAAGQGCENALDRASANVPHHRATVPRVVSINGIPDRFGDLIIHHSQSGIQWSRTVQGTKWLAGTTLVLAEKAEGVSGGIDHRLSDDLAGNVGPPGDVTASEGK